MAKEERRRSRRRKSAEGRGKTSRWLPLSPVSIWVRGEAETPSVGGGEVGGGSSWWLKWRGERERKNAETWAEGLVFGRLWIRFSPPSGHEMQPYL